MYPGTHDLIHLRTADRFFFFTDGRIVPETIRRSEDINEMNPEHPLRSLVLGCLQSLPEDRPTAVDLVNALTNFKESNDFYPSQNNAELQRSIHRVHASQYDYEFMLGDNPVGKTRIVTKFVRPNLSISPSTSSASCLSRIPPRLYESPARIRARKRVPRKRIERYPESISLKEGEQLIHQRDPRDSSR